MFAESEDYHIDSLSVLHRGDDFEAWTEFINKYLEEQGLKAHFRPSKPSAFPLANGITRPHWKTADVLPEEDNWKAMMILFGRLDDALVDEMLPGAHESMYQLTQYYMTSARAWDGIKFAVTPAAQKENHARECLQSGSIQPGDFYSNYDYLKTINDLFSYVEGSSGLTDQCWINIVMRGIKNEYPQLNGRASKALAAQCEVSMVRFKLARALEALATVGEKDMQNRLEDAESGERFKARRLHLLSTKIGCFRADNRHLKVGIAGLKQENNTLDAENHDLQAENDRLKAELKMHNDALRKVSESVKQLFHGLV